MNNSAERRVKTGPGGYRVTGSRVGTSTTAEAQPESIYYCTSPMQSFNIDALPLLIDIKAGQIQLNRN